MQVGILIAVAVLVVAVYFEPTDDLSPCGTIGETSCVGEKPNYGTFMPTFAKFVVFTNAYTCQQSLPPIISELENPTPGRLMILIYGARALAVLADLSQGGDSPRPAFRWPRHCLPAVRFRVLLWLHVVRCQRRLQHP